MHLNIYVFAHKNYLNNLDAVKISIRHKIIFVERPFNKSFMKKITNSYKKIILFLNKLF